MAVHKRQLKLIEFAVGDPLVNYECQIQSWSVENNTEDGEKGYTFCPDGAYVEDTDDDYALTLTFLADWRAGGISDFLVEHDGEDAAFTLDHHPDIAAEHVRWTGTIRIKAPNVGGDARATETQEATFQCVGKPAYSRVV